MNPNLATRLFRRLRGLGTCGRCGGPAISGECPGCLKRARDGLKVLFDEQISALDDARYNAAVSQSTIEGLRIERNELEAFRRAVLRRLATKGVPA